MPNQKVSLMLDKIAEHDRDVWAWLNKLADLCEKLGTCETD